MSYIWTHNGSPVPSATSSVYTLSAVNRSSGGNYMCAGRNSVGISGTSSVTVDVHYGPSVTVNPSTSTVKEGNTLTATCAVVSHPIANVTWRRKDGGSLPPQTGSTLTIHNIQRSQTGTYVCTATNTLSPCSGAAPPPTLVSKDLTVDVQYSASIKNLTINSLSGPVTVNENDRVILTCQVDSNPNSTIRLMNGSQKLRKADNSLLAVHDWEAGCRQRGNYSCTANNNIGVDANSAVKLAVKCSPRTEETLNPQFKFASALGGNVTISVPVLAYPLPTFTWNRTSSTSQNLNGSFAPVSDISVNITCDLIHLKQQDFGNYTLTVENGVGVPVSFTVTIVPQGPPLTPTNVSAHATGPNSLLVAWKPEFNGGAMQNFTVEYRKEKEKWHEGGTYDESKEMEYVKGSIEKLDPSTDYYVRVIAKNGFGKSNYTDSVSGRTKDEKIVGPLPGTSDALIGGAAGGSVAVLILVAVIVVVLVRRRNKGKDPVLNKSNGRFDGAGGRKRKDDDKLVMENDLYESAGNQRKSEINVTKPGPNGTQAGGVSDVYAVVDKKKKAPEPSADVYAKVEKADKKPAGAKEKKKEKEKVNKGKKDKGKGKDKDKKKKPKDDMIPLSKQRQGKNRDEYINTELDTDGNPYINYAFDDQNENATAAEPKEPSGAKTGLDEDGCVYLDLDFTGQKPSTEVKGDEESTEYAAIQIGVVGPKLKDDEKGEEKK